MFGFYHNIPMLMVSNNNGQTWQIGSIIRGNDSVKMLSNMMNQEPKDVVIKVKSSQIVLLKRNQKLHCLY
jgi:hypothetical protein